MPESSGKPPAPGSSGAQTVIFSKRQWSVEDARAWLRKHGFRSDSVDTTANTHRFRQFNPEHCAEGSYLALTKNFPAGVTVVVCTAKKG